MSASERKLISRLKKENMQLREQVANPSSDARISLLVDHNDHLYSHTCCTRSKFNFILERFIVESKKHADAPIFSEDDYEDPGNRCKCSRRSILFLALTKLYRNTEQVLLAGMANVDQSTISRYLVFSTRILLEILPTPEKISDIISETKSIKSVKKIIPNGETYIDGTYAKVQRPTENQEAFYSGKRKTHTYNTTITSNKDHLILDASPAVEGRTVDITMLRDNPPDFGKWTESMMNPNTPKDDMFDVYVDLGYLGIEKLYPGVRLHRPIKSSKLRPLTMTQKEKNRQTSKKRIKIEHVICRIKHYSRISDVYNGLLYEFDEDMQMVCGLVNLHIILENKRYRNLLAKI